jgi:alcohol dehydrogenase class IV
VTRVNLRALRARDAAGAGLARYTEAARIVTGDPGARPDELARWLEELCLELGTAGLRRYGVEEEDLLGLCEKASRASSMKGNPVALTAEELLEALEASLD